MIATPLKIAQARIADCLQLDEQGQLVQRRDYLNLAGLDLTDADLPTAFDVPERGLQGISLASLPHLRYLDLTGNRLTALPECVTGFAGLVWLGLNFNRITRLPEEIGALTNLQRLYLRENALEELPVTFLRLLEEVGADGKPVEVPLDLDMSGNPCQAATAASQGRDTLIAFLRALAQAEGRPQGKLLLVGEGRVGKSSLLRALLGLKHDENLLSTHGLKIESWNVNGVRQQAEPVQLNCWDFSGQEQMRETHQMFFTAPALYLLVWDPDRHQREAEQQLHEWLWLIHQSQREGTRARVLIVATNHRSRDRHEPDNKDHLLAEFGSSGAGILSGFASVECDDQRGSREGIEAVKDWVRQQIAKDRTFAQAVPETWERVVEGCLEIGKPVIPWHEFETRCGQCHKGSGKSNSPAAADAVAVARQMNALGRIVWYGDDPLLKDHVILRPDWLSKAISYVFERASLGAVSGSPETPLGPGLVSRQTMDALWRNPGTMDESGKAEPGYGAELYPVFRRLMRRFDLIQPLAARSIPGARQQEDAEADHYLVPARLGREQPATWETGWNPRDTMALRFSLTSRGLTADSPCAPLNDWLARAVFGRLIVWLHPLAQGREQVKDAAHWERGLRLRDTALGEARLRASADRIYFEGSAHLHGHVLYALGGLLTEMNRRFGTNMQFVEQVGCQPAARKGDPCPVCSKPLEQRRYFDPAELEKCRRPEDGEEPELQFRCAWESCPHKVDVLRSLHGVVVPSSSLEKKLEEVSGQITGLGDRLDSHFMQVQQQLDAQLGRIAEMLTESQGALTQDIRALAKEWLPQCKSAVIETLREWDADLSKAGPCLFSIETDVPYSFWTDLGPRLADKVRLHVHCEHTLLPVSWLKHDGAQAPGVFEIENAKDWLVKAGPVIQGLARILGAGALLTVALNPSVASCLKDQAEIMQAISGRLTARPNLPAAPARGDKTSGDPHCRDKATGEDLKRLQQLLWEKLGRPPDLARAAGLGLVRVWNKPQNRYAWVHPLYASDHGGAA
jgi:internalin A